MPYKKSYTKQNVGMGNSKTPDNVMGSQGKPAMIPSGFFHNRPTKHTTFEQGTAPRASRKMTKNK